MSRHVAIIGTAGRDRNHPLNATDWHSMRKHCASLLRKDDMLVSGGAAWADHLAVSLFLDGYGGALTLYLPCPLVNNQYDSNTEAGAISNYYHGLFSRVVGFDSLREVCLAASQANVCSQPGAKRDLFRRNELLAADADVVHAYTTGAGAEPSSHGTRHTWRKASHARRFHHCIYDLAV